MKIDQARQHWLFYSSINERIIYASNQNKRTKMKTKNSSTLSASWAGVYHCHNVLNIAKYQANNKLQKSTKKKNS